MLKTIIEFFEEHLKTKVDSVDNTQQLRLASATLLIEMIRMDHTIDESEKNAVQTILMDNFSLTADEAGNLFQLAEKESEDAVDYYRFAKLINTEYDNTQKEQIIENLWRIAYADGQLDKYEEHYLRKICELLHIPHKVFIQCKQRILDENNNSTN